MVLPLHVLDAAARRRIQRFCVALGLIWYARKTLGAFRDHHFHLQLQAEFQNGVRSRWSILTSVLRYTFASQLIASMEYLLPLAKPILALRIARLLVYKGENAIANLVYGAHPRNTIDIYGVEKTGEKKPVLVFVHGGAWSYGHKWQYGLVGQYLAKHGYLVGVINYRTYPTGNVHDQVDDVKDAIRWIAEHADAYGGDRDRIFLSGHSSGAHISALTIAQSALRALGHSKDTSNEKNAPVHHHIKGFIGLAGPYDIAEHYVFESNRKVGPIDGVHEISTMKPAMLGESKFEVCSPTKLFRDLSAADVSLPRFHIIHGNADAVVPASSSKKLAESLRMNEHDVEYIEIDGCTHEDMVFAVMGDNVAIKQELLAHLKRITQLPTQRLTRSESQAKL